MRFTTRAIALLVLCFLAIADEVRAQDAHYWQIRPGSRESLLGGADTAALSSSSAGYYNPARLSFIPGNGFSVSAHAYQMEELTINNGLGGGDDIDSRRFFSLPTMGSGLFSFTETSRHTFGYTMLTRRRYNANASGARQFTGDVQPAITGDEQFSGRFQFQESMLDAWIGTSWAMRINENWGIGLTQFFCLIDQESRIESRAHSVADNGHISSSYLRQEFGFAHLRTLSKLGVSWQKESWSAGLTLTAPSISLSGSGYLDFELAIIDIDSDGDSVPESEALIFRKEGLSSNYREPFSISIGVSKEFRDFALHGTIEYFAPLSRYNVFASEEQRTQVSNSPARYEFSHRSITVVNLAIGAETQLGQKTRGYASFRTDFSALSSSKRTGESGSDVALATWDIFHIAAGVSMDREYFSLALGLQFSWGNGPLGQPANFSAPRESNYLQGRTGRADAVYRAFTVLFGYTYVF